MPFPVIAREILATLMRAEANGKPISLQSTLDMWGRGSTWEDLVDGGYVHRSVETGGHNRPWSSSLRSTVEVIVMPVVEPAPRGLFLLFKRTKPGNLFQESLTLYCQSSPIYLNNQRRGHAFVKSEEFQKSMSPPHAKRLCDLFLVCFIKTESLLF